MAKTGTATGTAFDDQADSMMDWARTNMKMIGTVLAAIALAVVLWLVIRQWRDSRAAAADAALNRARQSYTQGNLPLAQTDLRNVIRRYDGSSAGSQATMLLAQVYYEQGKADSGLKVLNDGKAASVDRAAFEALKGAGYEQLKQYGPAAERYQAAAAATDAKISKDRYMADAARVLTLAGKKDEAAKIWTALANDDASGFSAEAKVRLGELTAKPVAR